MFFVYSCGFLLAVAFALLYYRNAKTAHLILAAIFTVLFIAGVVIVEKESSELYLNMAKQYETDSINDEKFIYKDTYNNSSAFQKENSSFEKNLLKKYPWHRNEINLMENNHLFFANDILENVSLGTIQGICDYDLILESTNDYFIFTSHPQQYLGEFCKIVGDFKERNICENPDILQALREYEGYTLVQEIGEPQSGGFCPMFLFYQQDETLPNLMRKDDIKNFSVDSGVYLGAYQDGNSQYQVFLSS